MDLNVFKLPNVDMKKRPRSWEIRPVPARTIELAKVMFSAVNTDAQSMISLMATFAEFQVKNPSITAIDEAIMLFLLDAVVQGLAASSATTYLRTIVSALARSGRPVVSPLIGDFAKILQLILAGEEVDHAIDISTETAWEIVRALDGLDKVVAFMMIAAGPRVADLTHVLKGDVIFEVPDTMKISFRRTKNHRTTGQRNGCRAVTEDYSEGFDHTDYSGGELQQRGEGEK